MINKKVISKLRPCKDRFDNYVKFYGDRTFTKRQFMELKSITQGDKLWVAFRLMPKENIALAAADIAESVLHIFKAKYPNDKRPRLAIEAARKGDEDADHAAAYAAAAAAYAAYAAAAADAAAYAAYAAAAADAAAYAAVRVVKDRTKQEKLIRTIVLKYWR